MNLRRFCTFLGIAILVTATSAEARVHRVSEGESIQAAVDAASPGDTILVDPGTYESSGGLYGLHITTDNLRLIGKVRKGRGNRGKVRIPRRRQQLVDIPRPQCEIVPAATAYKQFQRIIESSG